MSEFTPYMSTSSYLHEDIGHFTSVDDVAQYFDYTHGGQYTSEGSTHVAGEGSTHVAGEGSTQGGGTHETITQAWHQTEDPRPCVLEPVPRRQQPVRIRKRRPCGT